MFMASMTIC